MNPVPGWFPHHWHSLSHWQWFRLPPPSKSSLKEEILQPHVLWLSSYILSFTSIPHLSCSVLSPQTVPVPGLSHNFSTHWSSSILILPAVPLFLSFPLISLLSHSLFPISRLFAVHFQFSLIFHPFYPSCLTTPFISLCFSFNLVQTATSLLPGLSRIWGHGEPKPCGLSALPWPGWSWISLHWIMLSADPPFGV